MNGRTDMATRRSPVEDGLGLRGRILAALEAMTPKLRVIGELALRDPEAFIRKTSRELCLELGASEPTLIRFCKEMGYAGLAAFRIDLALEGSAPLSALVEPAVHERRSMNREAKRRIAARAAPLVAEASAILLDNGSTVEAFAEHLRDAAPLTILTTSLPIASMLMAQGRHEVMLTGGRVRPDSLALVGELAERALQGLRFDSFVMGVYGIGKGRIGGSREDEARQTRAMTEAADRVILLADASKFSQPALYKVCDLGRAAILVTDLPPDHPAAREAAAAGVEVLSVHGQDEEGQETT
ncbi:transcriptional regulator [Neomegalonema sp.]|uniref:DeoR/GlpR family DNA-binding transcription regulator n=1 Tax=Neomegalonema sp. TaxID=2039713 RepID=UPI00263365A2|nr:transcriptional regulator [Neomegalonema sp.]MDD2869194.1 transcriptional regulator [Neomegalonema sp.]